MDGNENNYHIILNSLKGKIMLARQRAAMAVNNELLTVYWEIGYIILQQQKEEGWGTKVINRLAADLKSEFPEMKGFSVRNLKYMRAFAEAYPQFVQQAAAHLPWGHHQLLLDKTKTSLEREFYIKKTVANGWSRNILLHQIESQLYLRQGSAITNFEHTLPKPQSDLAREILKNPYLFDFLGLTDEIEERELEKALIKHLKKFMLELGRGFAYVGNQYNLKVEGNDYFLDLLFYNYLLHCFVVFELKVGDFKPEFTGKLNFYINTINEQIRGKEDKPTIGVLLCKTPSDTVIQYSLQGIDTPIGISNYEFTKALPKQLEGEMPNVEELEHEILMALKKIAKEIQEAEIRHTQLGLSVEEGAFYEIFAKHTNAVSDVELIKGIVKEITDSIKKNLQIDWFKKIEIRAQIKLSVFRVLRKSGVTEELNDILDEIMEQAVLLYYEEWRGEQS
jgi:predicted nuclease of restriction endonuclease-like (RecB) superfamily